MEPYSALKKKKVTSLTRKWVELEVIMLNELNPAQKDKYVCFLMCGIQDFIKEMKRQKGDHLGKGMRLVWGSQREK